MDTRQKGNIAEERGCAYLREHGFRIVDRNVYNRFGEMDILAFKQGVLHCIEVKSALSYDQAVHNITPRKLQKLIRTLQTYLQQKRLECDYCMDALIVTDSDITFIENITL